MSLLYNCPNCDKELEGSFGDDIHCDICNKSYETEYEYIDYGNIACWIVKEIDNKINLLKGGIINIKSNINQIFKNE